MNNAVMLKVSHKLHIGDSDMIFTDRLCFRAGLYVR